MELNKNKHFFSLVVDDVEGLKKAIEFINAETGSDFTIDSYEVVEVGIAKVSVSNIDPYVIFKLGRRYERYRYKVKINW